MTLPLDFIQTGRTFEVPNYQPRSESCPDNDRGFFVAFLFSIIDDTAVRRSSLFREGLKTFALGWVRQRFKDGRRIYFVPSVTKTPNKPCYVHFTNPRLRSISRRPIQMPAHSNAISGTHSRSRFLTPKTPTTRSLFLRSQEFTNALSNPDQLHLIPAGHDRDHFLRKDHYPQDTG